VRGLVLVDPAGWPGRRGGPPPFIAALVDNPVGRRLFSRADPALFAERGLRAAYVDPALVTRSLVDRYVLLARAPGHRGILISQNSRPARAVTAATLADIRAPTLVIHGEADRLIPVADGRSFAAAIPGARLITYPGVGHVPMEQIPDRSASDLSSFLAALPPEN
jgi:pimeloyl-ACP methyl ester carboxylesterase